MPGEWRRWSVEAKVFLMLPCGKLLHDNILKTTYSFTNLKFKLLFPSI